MAIKEYKRVPYRLWNPYTQMDHLMKKLHQRDPQRFERFKGLVQPRPHPLFEVVPGGMEGWERVPVGWRKLERNGLD